jgi:hypothetical protein
LLPQQTGTMFVEFDWQKTANDAQIVSIHENSNHLTWILKSNSTTIQATYFSGGFLGSINGTLSASISKVKAAYAWTNGSQVLYVNGVQIGSAASTITDSSVNTILEFNGFWGNKKDGTAINSVALWKTKLQNAELATLTSL